MNIRQAQLPEGWEIKKLGDVLVKTEMVDPTKCPEKEFTYLDVSSVNKETKVIEGPAVLLGKDAPSRARKLVKVNDVIFATVRPTHSRVALITKEYDGQVCSTGYIVLRGKENINNKYLFYFLLTDEFNKQMEKLQKGASYPAVTDTEVKGVFLRYPKFLPEQQRIVSILERCFAAIDKAKANAEQNLKNAKELFESYLQGVFEKKCDGWEEKNLGEVVGKIMTGPFGSMLHQSDYVEEGIPVVNPQNIVDGKIVPLSKTMINQDTFSRLAKYALILGDIVIARRGEMGRCAVVRKENINWLCGTGSFVIRVNPKKADSNFLNLILSSNSVKQQLEKSSIGATMSNLNQTILSELPIRIPSVEEQQTIVRQLDALRAETQKLEAVYRKKIADLEELKKSILQKAFTGELTREEVEI
ncbi:restriction endonuclease subunit S [Lunatimonas salinarum]|uniref:restriction endonuclease subunit S n=1 Tax=Lunatimonas salinarum TaxID=1774590 RepID=UPI001ADF63D4|nr:restriction endonuclease subunit S [Lunatimonas salinarum]